MARRVVIVGGGFGGLACARALAGADVEVTLVDRRNHHLFQPLLYQVAIAGLAPSEIAAPIRGVLGRQRNARVLLGTVRSVDLHARSVQVDGDTLAFDHLVLAPGAVTTYFGHDDWAAHAPGLKSIEDAVAIRRRVLLAFEAAEREPDPGRRARLLSFVVVGGGPTGVELAGAIAELARFALSRDFRVARPSEARVLLVEGGDRILPSFDPSLSESAVQQLAQLGVHVRTGTRVTAIDGDGVRLDDEVIPATVIWAAGVAASPLLATLGAALDRQGRAVVGPDCALPGHPDVFVLGDAARFDGPDGPLPGVSPVAMQQGRYVAGLIATPGARPPFRYRDKGSMATIGRSRAIVQAGPLRLRGALAWLAWLLVHIWYLIDFRNRLLVLLDWTWSYWTFRRGARLITGGGPAVSPRSDRADAGGGGT